MKTIAKLLALFVCLLLSFVGLKFFFDIPASKGAVSQLNAHIGLIISKRTILHKWDGFVDITGYAAVPMNEVEFKSLVKEKNMVIENISDNHKHDGTISPYWFDKPSQIIYVLNRLEDKDNHNYIECHFNKKKNIAYFYYYDV